MRKCTLELTAKEAQAGTPKLGLLDQMLEEGRISPLTKQRLVLAFQEAFTNSLEHGSLELFSIWKNDVDQEGRDLYSIQRKERLMDPYYAERRLRVFAEYNDERLLIKILDEGPGFLLASTSDSFLKDGNMSAFGRGLTIISNIMDEVSFSEGGREIRMVKYLNR